MSFRKGQRVRYMGDEEHTRHVGKLATVQAEPGAIHTRIQFDDGKSLFALTRNLELVEATDPEFEEKLTEALAGEKAFRYGTSIIKVSTNKILDAQEADSLEDAKKDLEAFVPRDNLRMAVVRIEEV